MGVDVISEPPNRRLFGNASFVPALITLVSICGGAAAAAQDQITTVEFSDNEAVLTVERFLVDAERDAVFDDPRSLREFYEQRAYRLAWAGEERAEENAAIALRTVASANNDGLNRANYISDDGLTLAAIQLTDIELAERDLRLTDGLLRYMRDMRAGRVMPQTLSQQNRMVPESFDAMAALGGALNTGTLIDLIVDLPPSHAKYGRLKSALVRYRALEAQGDWPTLPVHSEIGLSDAEPRVAQLRARLVIE
jgi:murein L,D-transpeptidase YcbB/YkuD